MENHGYASALTQEVEAIMALEQNVQLDPEAMEQPAPFVNRIQVTAVGPNLVRMAFGEVFKLPSGEVYKYRSAVTMATLDVQQFAELLLSITSMQARANGASACLTRGLPRSRRAQKISLPMLCRQVAAQKLATHWPLLARPSFRTSHQCPCRWQPYPRSV